ncbi:MAG: metallophosphoesterase [Thermoprotei archaeon]
MYEIKILATSDIHAPRYTGLFFKAVKLTKIQPDIIILAGDLVEKNNVSALKPIYNYILNNFDGIPVFAVFGNEEYRGFENRYVEEYREFVWLNDEYRIVDVKETRVAIIGTRGALDKPTPWQARNIPGIASYYRELPERVSKYIDEIRTRGVNIVILVSHYGVTYNNLEGEPQQIWPYLASRRMENIIKKKHLDLVIHGHAHKAVVEMIRINNTPIYNVSLPARGRIVEITVSAKKTASTTEGLFRWIKK